LWGGRLERESAAREGLEGDRDGGATEGHNLEARGQATEQGGKARAIERPIPIAKNILVEVNHGRGPHSVGRERYSWPKFFRTSFFVFYQKHFTKCTHNRSPSHLLLFPLGWGFLVPPLTPRSPCREGYGERVPLPPEWVPPSAVL